MKEPSVCTCVMHRIAPAACLFHVSFFRRSMLCHPPNTAFGEYDWFWVHIPLAVTEGAQGIGSVQKQG